jgi:hypothetical protein
MHCHGHRSVRCTRKHQSAVREFAAHSSHHPTTRRAVQQRWALSDARVDVRVRARSCHKGGKADFSLKLEAHPPGPRHARSGMHSAHAAHSSPSAVTAESQLTEHAPQRPMHSRAAAPSHRSPRRHASAGAHGAQAAHGRPVGLTPVDDGPHEAHSWMHCVACAEEHALPTHASAGVQASQPTQPRGAHTDGSHRAMQLVVCDDVQAPPGMHATAAAHAPRAHTLLHGWPSIVRPLGAAAQGRQRWMHCAAAAEAHVPPGTHGSASAHASHPASAHGVPSAALAAPILHGAQRRMHATANGDAQP